MGKWRGGGLWEGLKAKTLASTDLRFGLAVGRVGGAGAGLGIANAWALGE